MMENNKLIAEFMGWKRGTNEETNTNQFFLAQPDHWYLKDENELEFHTSWDWLMPVVQKCFEVAENEDDFFDISGNLPYIEETYKSVVEFIKIYNDESYFLCGSCGERCDEYTYSEDRDVDECNDCKASNNEQ